MYPTNVKPPTGGRISRAVAGLSGRKRQLVAGSGKPTNYWVIKTENLLTWIEETQYATEDEVLGALQQSTDLKGLPEPGEEEEGETPF